ncbi:MAG: pilus assembly protein PilP [bacterium]
MRPVLRGFFSRIPLLILVLVVGVGVSGCKKSSPPAVSKPLPPLKPRTSAVTATAASEVVEGPFSYDPADYRDPFASLLDIKKVDDIPLEQLTPLQRVSLADIRLQGIILLGRKGVAQILTPDGKAHVVTPGTAMGRNRGKVVRITLDEVVVEEEFEDYLGEKIKQETVLRLRREEGENL